MPIKLRYKVNLVIMITFVMIAIVFSSILFPLQQRRLEASIAKIEIMLKTFVQQVKDPLANEIFENRRRAIKLRLEQMQQLKGVLALNVFDNTGRLLVTVGTLKSPSDLSAADKETTETGPFLQRERFKGIKAISFLQKLSVGGERIGFAQIHYSLSDILREHRDSFLIFIFLLASVLIAMLLLLNLLFFHMIISPIMKLKNLINKIQKDGPGEQMPIQSRDEIGDLATAFNQMSARLQKLIGRLEHQLEEQKEAEEALAFKNAVLSAQQESSPDGILVVDEKGNIILFNLRFQNMWGIAPEVMQSKSDEIALQSVFDKLVFPEEFLERVKFLYEHRNEKSYEEVSLIDGRIFERYSTPMFGPEGKYYGRVWNFHDITERKKNEEELRSSERLLADIINFLPDATFVIDSKGKVIAWNRSVEELTGINSEDMMGKGDYEYALPFYGIRRPVLADLVLHWDEEIARTYENVNRRGEILFSETRNPPFKPEPSLFWNTARPLHNARGDVVGAIEVIQDMTDRMRYEEELKKHRDHLEEMVETRTKELRDAQDELIRKERLVALGQLTATVAHEIRNPLGTVQTSVFSIGDAIKRKEMKRVNRALILAERNIRRCDEIITELLDFTRKKVLKKASMDIDAWLENLMDEHKLPEGIEYKPEINSGIQISFDPEYLRRAVINVITNAVQAMEEEESPEKELMVKTAVVENRLEIKIIDNGSGIPDDIGDKIFDLLFSTKNFGIGLGLTIVQDIMEQHGGGIEVESEEDKGTSVVLWLPIN